MIFKHKLKNENIVLVDHGIKEGDVFRLRYINFHNSKKHPDQYGLFDMYSMPFKMPEGMNLLDAFKILSYLINYFEEKFNIPKFSPESLKLLDRALNYEALGFQKYPEQLEDTYVNDLFMVTGSLKKFTESSYYENYFNWYIPNITIKEIKIIYDIYNIKPKRKVLNK